MIRWNRSDAVKLGRAIADYNKIVSKMEQQEKSLNILLPDKLDYSTAKQEIVTRSDLNKLLNSLKRIKKQDATKLIELDSGIKITKYEKNEMSIQRRSAKMKISHELDILEKHEMRVDGQATKMTFGQMQSTSKNNLKAKSEIVDKDIQKMNKEQLINQRYKLKNYSSKGYYQKQNSAFKQGYLEAIYVLIIGMPGARELASTLEKVPDEKFYYLSQQDKITSSIDYIYEITMVNKLHGPTEAQYMLDRLIQAWEITLQKNHIFEDGQKIYDNSVFEG